MVIGILQFELLIHGAESLKDKRRVVNSVKDRFHREHMVSIAEVGNPDNASVAVLGLACVGREGKHIGEVLDRITARLRRVPGAELGDTSRQILQGMDPMEGELTLPGEAAGSPRAGLAGREHDLDQEMLRRAAEVESERQKSDRRPGRTEHQA